MLPTECKWAYLSIGTDHILVIDDPNWAHYLQISISQALAKHKPSIGLETLTETDRDPDGDSDGDPAMAQYRCKYHYFADLCYLSNPWFVSKQRASNITRSDLHSTYQRRFPRTRNRRHQHSTRQPFQTLIGARLSAQMITGRKYIYSADSASDTNLSWCCGDWQGIATPSLILSAFSDS